MVHVVTSDELPFVVAKWDREDKVRAMKRDVNETLAIWAGFERRGASYRGKPIWVAPEEIERFDRVMAEQEDGEYQRMPESDSYYAVPGFTDSLDKCFEHLVPQIEMYCGEYKLHQWDAQWVCELLFSYPIGWLEGVGGTPSRSLCNAILAYIKVVKKEGK